jgi:glyoxylase-like metal-dependent hydrolase (beta-lactamase superfamily II)
MIQIDHLSAGWLCNPPGPWACCHVLRVRAGDRSVLIDTGIGLADVRDPVARIGKPAIDAAGFRFEECDTALRQLERLGTDPTTVTDIVLTHLDPDHVGGLSDFPHARVHVSAVERDAAESGDPRYRPVQWSHSPNWCTYAKPTSTWFGFDAFELDLPLIAPLLLIPLPGHTPGHCGVAIRRESNWLLHVGDAYYLRAELADASHPVDALARINATDDPARRSTLQRLRDLLAQHAGQVQTVGYHDVSELPESVLTDAPWTR